VTDWGDKVTRWEGEVAGGTVMAMVNTGTIKWLAADASYGNPSVTLTADLRSRHIARLLQGSLTATRGSAHIQFRNAITPFALAADGAITNPFPIPATLHDGRGPVSGQLTLCFSNS
jgi:hypothetical protein